jgi:hypothetical protein
MPAGSDTRGVHPALRDLVSQVQQHFGTSLGSGPTPTPETRRRRRPSPASRERADAQLAKDREIRRLVQQVARSFDFTLQLVGEYASGTAYADVIGYLAERGKDFLHVSPNMRRAVAAALVEEFVGEPRIPRPNQINRVAGEAILAIVVKRFENRLRDVRIRANKDSYTRKKIADGYDSRVGICTGQLLENVRDADVEVDFDTE